MRTMLAIMWQLWRKGTGIVIGVALTLVVHGIVQADELAMRPVVTNPAGQTADATVAIQAEVPAETAQEPATEISEEALTEALNATAKEMGLDARANVIRTTGAGQHTILQVHSDSGSFDITLYDAPAQSREAHARGFVGKKNRRFDFHGYPAVEATYAAGSRGPIHGLMIQMGRANFRAIVPKPKVPDAARDIAELFRRHAMERGLMK